MLDAAIANERQLRIAGAAQHQAELDSLTGQIAATQTAIDRYLSAFENGTLDESICGRRINQLTTQLDQLTARQTELDHHRDEVRRPTRS